ncbi:hypothetical protein LTR62_000230 [Meristemomyces frigidus]|uniref:XPG-I domain-containing protein n=1 Tax=Meristemomyces frigidus TaxID=1508187 RepID=A0AAN7TZ36_9PEZI|nr:hypothetical protein LTR62_000230 [Meristemomyces frigidus]
MATFKAWVRNEALESTGKLDQFRDTAFGIDADEYLDTLLTNTLTKEPLLPALGGLPFALAKHVDDDLESFTAAGIKPVFVFNGLQTGSKDKAGVLREVRKAAADLDDAWSIYDQGRGEEAVAAFGKACTYKTAHISRWLQLHLFKRGASIFTAPYTASSQLNYLRESGYVDVLLGSVGCLIFGASKVVTSISFDSKAVTWVESKVCQGKLMLTLDGFVDTMLLAGCFPTLLPALPEVDAEQNRVQAVRGLISRANGDAIALLQQQKDDEYLASYRKAKYFTKHPIELTEAGSIEAKDLSRSKTPADLHEVTGRRLPDELMYYLSRGLVGARVLNWSAHSEVVETPPLDGGNSDAYRDLVQNKLNDLRRRSLAVISSQLHRHFQASSMQVVYWFTDATNKIILKDEIESSPPTNSTFHLQKSALPENITTRPLLSALEVLADKQTAKSTITQRPKSVNENLTSATELLGNTVFRFLRDTKYVGPDHTLTSWGRALRVAMQEAENNGLVELGTTTTEIEEALFMAFELLRLRILHSQNLFPIPQFSGQPLRGTEVDKSNTLLISRVACLGLFRHRQIGYTGPLSRHLLAFHQMAAAVRTSMRDLLEMHACAMLMSGVFKRDAMSGKEMTEVGSQLPFVREPDLGLALIVKSFLDEQSNEPEKRQDVTRWFNYVTDMDGDLKKAWKLWACVNAGVQSADTIVASEAMKQSFRQADEWLQKKLATTNGAA